MITLLASDLEWIRGAADDLADQCAHGRVEFRVNGTVFVRPEDGQWTASAAALYLLRTLSHNHTAQESVAENNYLFPCCGFSVWPIGERFEVVCLGCDVGIDVDVIHEDTSVTLRSLAATESVPESEWRSAVLAFAAQVREFYRQCTPKVEIGDSYDRQGWAAFWQEWDERVAKATSLPVQ